LSAAHRYAEWLRENGVVKTPATRTRRHALAEQLRGLEKSIERRSATAKHAPTKRDAEKIQEQIDRLQDREMRLEQELNGIEPIGYCARCGGPILDQTETDYGVCRRCRTYNPERSQP